MDDKNFFRKAFFDTSDITLWGLRCVAILSSFGSLGIFSARVVLVREDTHQGDGRNSEQGTRSFEY